MGATYEWIEFLVARSWKELKKLWPEGQDELPAAMPAELQQEGYIQLETSYCRDWIDIHLRRGLIEVRFYAQAPCALPDPDYEEEARAVAKSVDSLYSAYARVGKRVRLLAEPSSSGWEPWQFEVSD